MADTKISALTELTTPEGEDLLVIVDDPSGTPVTKKILVESLVGKTTQSTNSTNTSTSGTTYVDTGLSASITPSSTSSKIRVTISQPHYAGSTNSTGSKFRILRDSTPIVDPAVVHMGYISGGAGMRSIFSYSYIDSPSTTSSITYKTQFNASTGAGTVYVNQDGALSVIILEEIIVNA